MKVFISHRATSPRYHLTRAQLRELAKAHNVPRGRNTPDTVANLRKAGDQVLTTKGTNTMNDDRHTPAFPNEGQGEWADPEKMTHWQDYTGLTRVEHAALVTGQPCSGTPWLDEMLAKARRERLAAQASEQDIRHHQEFKQCTTMYGTPDGSPVPKYSREQARWRYADALIAALEGGGK